MSDVRDNDVWSLEKRTFKGHFRQHSSQIGKWCDIFSSRMSLKGMELFYEANTVSVGPVSHELYERKTTREKKLHSKSIFFDDVDLNFTRFSPNRLILKDNSSGIPGCWTARPEKWQILQNFGNFWISGWIFGISGNLRRLAREFEDFGGCIMTSPLVFKIWDSWVKLVYFRKKSPPRDRYLHIAILFA